MMFKKYFIIIATIIIFFSGGEASALRVPMDPDKTVERMEVKRLYNAVIKFMDIMRKELDFIDKSEFIEIKKDASSLRGSVKRMFKAGWDIYYLTGFSNESWPRNVRNTVTDFLRADTISGAVHWIEKAIAKKEDIEKMTELFDDLKQRVENERDNLDQLKSILSEKTILHIAKGEYLSKIFKEKESEADQIYTWNPEWEKSMKIDMNFGQHVLRYLVGKILDKTSDSKYLGSSIEVLFPELNDFRSEVVAQVFRGICKINFDFAAAMLISYKPPAHHVMDAVFFEDYDKLYFAAVVNRAIQLLKKKADIKVKQAEVESFENDIYVNVFYFTTSLVKFFVGLDKKKNFLDNLDSKSSAFFINSYYLFRGPEKLAKEGDQEDIELFRGIIRDKENIALIDYDVRIWLGFSDIAITDEAIRSLETSTKL